MSVQLGSDINNPNFSGAYNPDSILHVTFYMNSIQNNFESEKHARPIFNEIPFVRILTPGNQLSVIDTYVREEHKRRFPIQWAAFQNSHNEEDQVVGTPLSEWTAIGRNQADELKALKFFTVEQIAGASDLQIQRLGMNGAFLKQKARAFLDAAKDSAVEQKLAADLLRKDQEITELRASQDRILKMMEEMQAKMSIPTEEKPKRKYVRKENVESEVETND